MPTKTKKKRVTRASATFAKSAKTAQKDLREHVADRICRLADGMIRISARSILQRWGIRHTDLRLMNVLDNEEPLSINELSRRAIVDQAWVSRSIKTLEQKNLVVRQGETNESRRLLISLTKKGRQTLDQVRPHARRSEEILLKKIDAQRLKQLLDQLEINVDEMVDMLTHVAPVGRTKK